MTRVRSEDRGKDRARARRLAVAVALGVAGVTLFIQAVFASWP